jgi:hypothetical protein
VRYRIQPWSRIDPVAARGQLQRDVSLFDKPNKVRWVFDGGRLGQDKRAVVDAMRRALRDGDLPKGAKPDYQRWLGALDRIVVVV